MAKKQLTKYGELLVDITGTGTGGELGKTVVPGGQVFILLNAVDTTVATGTGTGAVPSSVPGDLGLACKNFTMVVTESGSITTHGIVKLQGSLDGTNWYDLVANVTGNGSTPATGTSTTLHARYIRPNVTTAQVATSGTVTMTAAVAASQ